MRSLVNLVLITGWLIPLYTATQPEPETVDLQVWFDFFTSDVTVRKFQVKVLAQVLDVPKMRQCMLLSLLFMGHSAYEQ